MRKQSQTTLERTPSRLKVEKLLALLAEREMTRAEIGEKLFLSESQAYRYMRCLCQQRKVYVKRWIRSEIGGMPTAVYAAGDRASAPRPRRLTKAEQARRQYQRMKREQPEKYMRYLLRARRAASRGKATKADPLLAWIPRRDMREAA